MTLCGGFRCPAAVVLFADRQETIGDYAKWDASKFYIYTLEGNFRVVMTGAGESDPIEMVWDAMRSRLGKISSVADVKAMLLSIVNEVTRKTIFPLPRDERQHMDLVWAVQPLGQPYAGGGRDHIELFRTYRLSHIDIKSHYFTGNPRLLAQYLNDQYLRARIIGAEEAEALAAYMLWEASEYDTYCGKHADVFTLRNDDSITRLPQSQVDYWHDHWRQFKGSIGNLALLSCATAMTQKIYDPDDHLKRVSAAIRLLNKEQVAMRQKYAPERSELERKLMIEVRKVSEKIRKQKNAKLMRLASQMSKDQQ